MVGLGLGGMNMRKRIIYIVILLSLIIQLLGCGNKDKERLQRIVPEEDVKKQNLELKNKDSKVTVERLNLELDEGDYFNPSFYYQGEAYGYVGKGFGIIKETKEITKTHPIKNSLKQYLYKIDKDNNLVETPKEAFNLLVGARVIDYKMFEQDKVYGVDYEKEDKSIEIPELTEVIADLKRSRGNDNDNYYYYHITTSGKENYVVINEFNLAGEISEQSKTYLYDLENKKLYEGKNKGEGWIYYVESLKSFMWMDEDSKLYKIALKGEYFHLDKYIDLDEENEVDWMNATMINNDEMLLFKSKYFSTAEDEFHPKTYYRTTSIGKFNFKTNQYKVLFKAPRKVNIYAKYIENNILVLEEFREQNGFIKPIKRYLKEIDDDGLKALFEEEIEDEGETRNPYLEVVTSEDGKEILLTREITNMEDGVETTKEHIYKRYTIQ